MIKLLILPMMVFSLGCLAFTKQMANPNQEMKSILDALEKKGGKPIEKLSVIDARKQPTPTDAVKSIMITKNDAPTQKVISKDILVSGSDGVTHEFFGMASVLKEARDAQNFASKNLTKSFKQ